ncbi:MAG: hypothetical protein AAF549_05800 [Pseudomonadota bacterium]
MAEKMLSLGSLKRQQPIGFGGIIDAIPRALAKGTHDIGFNYAYYRILLDLSKFGSDGDEIERLIELKDEHDITASEIADALLQSHSFARFKKELISNNIVHDIDVYSSIKDSGLYLTLKFTDEFLIASGLKQQPPQKRRLLLFLKRPPLLIAPPKKEAQDLIERIYELSSCLQEQAIQLGVADTENLNIAVKEVVELFESGNLHRANLRHLRAELRNINNSFEELQGSEPSLNDQTIDTLKKLYMRAVTYAEGLSNEGMDSVKINAEIAAKVALIAPARKIP